MFPMSDLQSNAAKKLKLFQAFAHTKYQVGPHNFGLYKKTSSALKGSS